MQRCGAVFSQAVLLPTNPKSSDTMSCPCSCASSIRCRQCGSSFTRDATQAEHQVRNGMWVAECKSLSNSLGSAGALFTRASRRSPLISRSAAFMVWPGQRSPEGPAEIKLSPTVAQGSRLTTLRRTLPSVFTRSQIPTLTPDSVSFALDT